MTNDFQNWLMQNGLTAAFTTSASDTLYTNRLKGFGVLHKNGEKSPQSFYLEDIVELKTYDDENLVVEWNRATRNWRIYERSTRHSTNEVYTKIRLVNGMVMKLQLFHATYGNIERESYEHINLFNYAVQITQILLGLATGA